MSDTLIRELTLENGCRLALYDQSRQIAADRWKLVLTANLEIDVRRAMQGNANLDADNVIAALGDRMSFEKKIERVFVEDNTKTELFDQLLNNFMQSTVAYLAHPAFPGRYVAKQYAEYQKRAQWYQ